MAGKKVREDLRISFNLPERLTERAKTIPWGVRTKVMSILLERVLDAAEDYGSMIYGALLDGDFEIKYKRGKKK